MFESKYICTKIYRMKTYLLNASWLIMVSLLANNLYSQITINPSNNVEITFSCDELEKIPVPIAESTCEGELKYSFEDKTYSGGCLGTIERNWLISDNCNNEIAFQQFIRLTDDKAPVLSEYPQNKSAFLEQVQNVQEITAKDNCSKKVEVEFIEKVTKDEKGNITFIKRIWKAEDQCGNINIHDQTIAIKAKEK